jgi:hypothetical protein
MEVEGKQTEQCLVFSVNNFSFSFDVFSPEQLWILNPKRILKKLDLEPPSKQPGQESTVDKASSQAAGKHMIGSNYSEIIIVTLLVD